MLADITYFVLVLTLIGSLIEGLVGLTSPETASAGSAATHALLSLIAIQLCVVVEELVRIRRALVPQQQPLTAVEECRQIREARARHTTAPTPDV